MRKNLEKNAQDEITAQCQISSADSFYITVCFGLDSLAKRINALYIIKAGFFEKKYKRTIRILDSLEYLLS